MNKASIAAFAKQMASTIKEAFGDIVTLSGTEYTAAVSVGEPELNLEEGGYMSPVDFIVRIPIADLAIAPAVRSPVVIGDTTYRVTSVRKAFGSLAQEWIIEVSTP